MKLVTAKQLYKDHGIRPGVAYRMAKAGLIPVYRIGIKRRGVRFIAEEVLEALRHTEIPSLASQRVLLR